jgi:threonylcarbamoyladenosine tRNA methylthiotransferase MtaB
VTGIHIGHYGVDTGDSLSMLMTRLVRDVAGVRFRLSSLEATEVDARLAELFGERERLAPHLHAPLQSGSDSVLKRMGRHWYTASTYRQAVERLALRVEGLALGADVIAGFPGESDADHRATVAFLETLPFTYLHVFPYSARPGTAAERLKESVPSAVAGDRARELRLVGDRAATAHRARRLGKPCDLVVMGGEAKREGLTEDYLTVDVDASIPRGTRWHATLAGDATRLLGVPHEPIIRA